MIDRDRYREHPSELAPGQGALPSRLLAGSPRERLQEAMAQICAQRGYAATTIADVTRRAGVADEAFHKFFRDKEDCFLATLNDFFAEATTAVATAVTGASKRPDAAPVRDAAAALLELMSERPAHAAICLIDARAATPSSRAAYHSGVLVMVSTLERAWRGSDAGSDRPAIASRAALGGAEALLRRELALGHSATLPELLPELLYCAMVPLVGPKEAARSARAPRGVASRTR